MKTIRIILFVFIAIIFSAESYIVNYIDLDFEGLLYTFVGTKTGTSSDVLLSVAKHIIPILVFFIIVFLVTIYIKKKDVFVKIKIETANRKIEFDLMKVLKILEIPFMSIVIILTLVSINNNIGFSDYYIRKNQKTSIYEDYYKDIRNTNIEQKEKRNLILIYLESMETSFMSKDNGGFLNYELIPNLIKLGNENINFSSNDKIGGYNVVTGSTWTMGALFSSQSGIPFSFPIDGNEMSIEEEFAPNVVTLGDILAKNGYKQEFLCGSDAKFASRSQYFKTHGNYKIYDYYTALENGVVDNYVWWGFDDKTLYDIAKSELLELSSSKQPFNLTMLTVDTHHVGGYVCDLCDNNYDNQYANVIACADKQIYDFVEWIKTQDFYDDTTIVIIGDHPTMDSTLINSSLERTDLANNRKVSSSDIENRYVYNCFINSIIKTNNVKNRSFNVLDMFPSILSSIGFEIEDNKLGLGTNIFSNEQTFQEKLGYEYINNELSKYSDYYVENFY